MNNMRIIVHTGQNQIGGSVIEISTETTRIFLDLGANMDDADASEVPEVEGLFTGKRHCDAVFITHYHDDHIGLIGKMLPGIPVYMGETAFAILKTAENYWNRSVPFQPEYVHDREKVRIGNLEVTPFRCDHSAYDAYMYLVEGDGKSVLYTGDFRSHGRRDFNLLLQSLPRVNVLITEGTTLSRETATQDAQHPKGVTLSRETAAEDEQYLEGTILSYENESRTDTAAAQLTECQTLSNRTVTEDELVEAGAALLKDCEGPVFVLMSPLNVDRLITCYQIAQKTGRIFLEDPYAAAVADAAGDRRKEVGADVPNHKKQMLSAGYPVSGSQVAHADIPVPGQNPGIRVFRTATGLLSALRFGYGRAAIRIRGIRRKKFLMCVRPSMRQYLKLLSGKISFRDGILLYSMFSGHLETPSFQRFMDFAKKMGLRIEVLHTSGHADAAAIDALIRRVDPDMIIPVHTELAEWFLRYEPQHKVILEAQQVICCL